MSEISMPIETSRLQLLPYSPAHLLALIESVRQFEERFGLRAAEGLRDFYVSGEIPPAWLDQLRAATEADLWVHGFAVVERESQTIIGSAGFKGPPDRDGLVEIGYGIVPLRQGRGYATEAAAALVAFAVENFSVKRIRAHTLPTPNASTRVLEKCGFQHLGEVTDPEDGRVWRWERHGAAPETAW
jgi:RimJ/RimL family protein N-acetyltransferase